MKKFFFERDREREPFSYWKNMQRIGENGNFIVKGRE